MKITKLLVRRSEIINWRYMRIANRCRIIVILTFLLAAIGCVSVQTNYCAQDEKLSINDLMYFGTAKPDGVVTPGQWAEFLKNSVTPRFPQGFTAWRASGQWKGSDGIIMQEESFALSIVHPDDKSSDEAIRSIIREYKLQFNQEAVLRVRSHACSSF
jgi:hypothetical protein